MLLFLFSRPWWSRAAADRNGVKHWEDAGERNLAFIDLNGETLVVGSGPAPFFIRVLEEEKNIQQQNSIHVANCRIFYI